MKRDNLIFWVPFTVYFFISTLSSLPAFAKPDGIIPEVNYFFRLLFTLVVFWSLLPSALWLQWKIHPKALWVGIGGAFVWFFLCFISIRIYPQGLLPEDPTNSSFLTKIFLEQNYGYLAVRLFSLCVMIPLIEEFFFRGCVMSGYSLPLGTDSKLVDRSNGLHVVVAVCFGFLHPTHQILAGVVWFLLVSFLSRQTKNIWDCVVAHAVTNILLFVIVSWAYFMGKDWWRILLG